MVDIFQVDENRDIPQEIADGLLKSINDETSRRIGLHRDNFRAFWYSQEATPQQLCDKMGANAWLFFAIASANVQHIASIAQLSGKTLADFLQPEDYVPPKTVTVNNDGTVTIGE
jgi:hypothetical protein